MDQTRIVYVSFDRFPSPKGAATHIDAFVSALGKHFGNVDLLTVPSESMERANGATPGHPGGGQREFDEQCESGQEWTKTGVTHHPLFAPGANLFERVLSFRQQCRHWWRREIENQYRVAPIAHFRSIFEGYPIAREKERYCSKLVYEVNGLPSIELKYRYPDVAEDAELLRKLRHQEDVCMRAADLILTVSEVNAEHLASRGVPENRIEVIPNGVDTDLFAYRPFRTNRYMEIIGGSPMKLLYSGTMSAWQGVVVAIEALALYRRDFPAELTLVGVARPKQRRELMKSAWNLGVYDQVRLLDPVSKTELAKLHSEADVILAPLTRNDRNLVQGCCPLKVLEAMASGTPLVASDLPVVRELVDHETQALLVRPGAAKSIKDAMLRLRSEPGLATKLSVAARQRARRDFTWIRAQNSLISAYERRCL